MRPVKRGTSTPIALQAATAANGCRAKQIECPGWMIRDAGSDRIGAVRSRERSGPREAKIHTRPPQSSLGRAPTRGFGKWWHLASKVLAVKHMHRHPIGVADIERALPSSESGLPRFKCALVLAARVWCPADCFNRLFESPSSLSTQRGGRSMAVR